MKIRKQTVQGECFYELNDGRIHQDMKIARTDSAVNLGCSDWCGLPVNASEMLSEQAPIFPPKG